MSKYKLATSGYLVVEVEADSPDEAADKLFEDGLNELYNQEIHEIVKAGEAFKLHADLNG